MKIEEYWNDIDIRLEELAINGFVKLPSLDKFDLDLSLMTYLMKWEFQHSKNWDRIIRSF